MSFAEWIKRGEWVRIERLYKSAKWRLWGQWPIHAMLVGWNARVACERLERMTAKNSVDASLADRTALVAAPGSGALTWTAEQPKRRGWWWLLDPDFDGATVRRVDEIDGKLRVWLPLDNVWMTIADTQSGWLWAGPLVEPVKAPAGGSNAREIAEALRSSEIQVRARCLDPKSNEASLVRMAFVQGALWRTMKVL